MIKKMGLFVLAAAMLSGVLYGCGGGDDTPTATTTTTAATTTTTAATTTTTAATTTTTTTTTTVPLGPVAVSAANATAHDATAANFTYTINAASSYTYTISGFAAGDKLVFPAGQTPTVNNISYADGSVTVQYALNGNTVAVVLTGITNAQDIALNFISDFNTLFGAGTI